MTLQPISNLDPCLQALTAITNHRRRIFTQAEARRAGFTRGSIAARRGSGVWIEVARNVYCAAPVGVLDPNELLLAHVLSADGFAHGRSALALFGLISSTNVHHIVVPRTRRNLDRVVLHSSLNLPESDLTVEKDVPTTTVERALIDSAAGFHRRFATRIIAKAIVRRLANPDPLRTRALELLNSRRPGAAVVASIVDELHPNLDEARNEWEAMVVEVAQHFDLPKPELNFRVELPRGHRFIDVAWPDVKRGIEYDGYWEHLTSLHRFEDDRWRDIDLQAAGWRVDHCNANMLRNDATRVFGPITRALGRPAVA